LDDWLDGRRRARNWPLGELYTRSACCPRPLQPSERALQQPRAPLLTRCRPAPPSLQAEESAWSALAYLGGLTNLQELICDCGNDGSGMAELACSAPGLAPSLTVLQIDHKDDDVPAAVADLSFVTALTCLQSLDLWKVMLAPPGLPQMLPQTLTHVDLAATDLGRSDVAALVRLTALETLKFNYWTGGVGAGSCSAVYELRCNFRQRSDLVSLVAAFPHVRNASLGFENCEPNGAPLPPLGTARWRGATFLGMSGTDILVGGSSLTLVRILLLLGALDGDLQSMILCTSSLEDPSPAAVGDAELQAILRAAPGLTSLRVFAPELTDAAFAGCPRLPSLESLDLLNAHQGEFVAVPLALTAAGLRAMGAALPGVQDLYLCDKATERAWIEALKALGAGGVPVGAPPAVAAAQAGGAATGAGDDVPPAAAPDEGPAAADAQEQQEDGEEGEVERQGNRRLLLAIRAALQRVPLPSGLCE
jgi:hypothetical protein